VGNIISGSVSYVLVPALVNSTEEAAAELIWDTGAAITLVLSAAAVALWVSADLWIPWVLPGFSPPIHALAKGLIQIQLYGVVFAGIATVLTSAHNARGCFAWPAVFTATAAVLPVIVLTVTRETGVELLAWALVVRPILLCVFLLSVALPFRSPSLSRPAFRSLVTSLMPLTVGSAYYKTEQLVDRVISSFAPAGALSLLHLGQQIYGAGNQLLAAGVAMPAVPRLASVATRNPAEFLGEVSVVTRWLLFLGACGYVAIAIVGRPVLEIFLGHGKVSPADLHKLWLIMMALAGVWFGGLAGLVFSNAFYALGDTRTPTRIGIIGYTIGIFLKIMGFLAFGVIGLALGTGIYYVGNAVALLHYLTKRSRLAG
jgi:peptidoglycan biosynthesis protein MviN/MurJ (putative lipid II flippase)